MDCIRSLLRDVARCLLRLADLSRNEFPPWIFGNQLPILAEDLSSEKCCDWPSRHLHPFVGRPVAVHVQLGMLDSLVRLGIQQNQIGIAAWLDCSFMWIQSKATSRIGGDDLCEERKRKASLYNCFREHERNACLNPRHSIRHFSECSVRRGLLGMRKRAMIRCYHGYGATAQSGPKRFTVLRFAQRGTCGKERCLGSVVQTCVEQ